MRVDLLLLAFISLSAAFPKESRITGGSSIQIQNVPYMANVQRVFDETWWYQTCGGSVLTSLVILSAAHCFYEETFPLVWRIRLGSHFASSGGSLHPVFQIVLHPEFTRVGLDKDVALVRLATPAVFSDTVRVARIAGPNYNLADSTMVTAYGWGYNMRPTSEILLHVNLRIVNQEHCAERYAYLKTQPGFENWPDVNENMICSDPGICSGDSGGPLAHQGDVIVGVVSFAYGCGNPRYPSVYARLSRFSDWIAANA